MRSLPAPSNRWSLIIVCFFGLCLHAGCGSGDSGSPQSGTASPRMEKFQEAKAKADTAKKLGKKNRSPKGV